MWHYYNNSSFTWLLKKTLKSIHDTSMSEDLIMNMIPLVLCMSYDELERTDWNSTNAILYTGRENPSLIAD